MRIWGCQRTSHFTVPRAYGQDACTTLGLVSLHQRTGDLILPKQVHGFAN